MSRALRNYFDRAKPNLEGGGKLATFRPVFDGFETFSFVPNEASKAGVHIHGYINSEHVMTVATITLLPALFSGMYSVGYQYNLVVGVDLGFLVTFISGFLTVLPKTIVSYMIGLGIEFVVAQVRKEKVQGGSLVSGILTPMIAPVDTPLRMIVVATALAATFAREVSGGAGYNIFDVTLVIRASLLLVYLVTISGNQVLIRTADIFGTGAGRAVNGLSEATPLGQVAIAGRGMIGSFQIIDILGNPVFIWDAFTGLIPGSIDETSVLAILIGVVILLATGIAGWETIVSVSVGGASMSLIFNMVGTMVVTRISPLDHLFLGGFTSGAMLMATDPVTPARMGTGKYIYGFPVGAMAIIVHVLNPGYPEGMILAILLVNVFAPLTDYYIVEANISRRLKCIIK